MARPSSARTIPAVPDRPPPSSPAARGTSPGPPPDDARPDHDAPEWIETVVSSPLSRSAYASLVAHVILGIVLVLAVNPAPRRSTPRPLVLSLDDGRSAAGPDEEGVEIDAVLADAGAAGMLDAPAEAEPTTGAPPAPDPAETASASAADEPEHAPPMGPVDDATEGTVAVAVAAHVPRAGRAGGPFAAGIPGTGGDARTAYESRRGAARGTAARGRGGTPASEAAVERGLAWLALHQAGDGSWRFDLAGCRCDGACRDPGSLASTTASTAIALLPFLGAGNTHLDGRHSETVSRGIYYLLGRMQSTPRGGDLCEGTMYGHGIATLVLCEALGMTGDDLLRRPCRDAVRFIETSQDLHGGGWRYLPGQSGDITVTAWQLAALRSAGVAGVETSSPTFEGARRFLDSVATRNGAAYGYRTPAAGPCTSAIGLLCRMYTGWAAGEEALDRGITALAKPGPKPHAVYHNFYLAQALVQTDHPVWPRWNARNRDQIVALQSRLGHEAGSWFFADRETAPGGRLAHTALAVLTLEVYYRLLPIYREEAVSGTP